MHAAEARRGGAGKRAVRQAGARDFARLEATAQEALGQGESRGCGERPPGHQRAESCRSLVGSGDAPLARLLQPERRSSPAWRLGRSCEPRVRRLPSFCQRLGTRGGPGTVFWLSGTAGGRALRRRRRGRRPAKSWELRAVPSSCTLRHGQLHRSETRDLAARLTVPRGWAPRGPAAQPGSAARRHPRCRRRRATRA